MIDGRMMIKILPSAESVPIFPSSLIPCFVGVMGVKLFVFFEGDDNDFIGGIDNINIVDSTAKPGSLFIVK